MGRDPMLALLMGIRRLRRFECGGLSGQPGIWLMYNTNVATYLMIMCDVCCRWLNCFHLPRR